jgi:sugar phosphate permease
MKLPPPFFERPFWLQLVGGIVVPLVFGILSGFALGWNEILYIVMAGPIAILGGFLAGVEHRETDEGVLRGAIGGLVYGSFILIGHEIMNNEPKAELPDPQSGLVFVTALGGAILGGLGARYRKRHERRLEAAAVR